MAKSFITMAVMSTTTTDDKIVVYVKRHEKWEWLWDLLLDEARQEIYVENIEAHLRKHRISKQVECDAYLMSLETCKELRFTKCIKSIQLVALPPSW